MRIFLEGSMPVSGGLMWLSPEPTTAVKQPGVQKDEGPILSPRNEVFPLCVCALPCVMRVYLHACLGAHACVYRVEVSSQPPVVLSREASALFF